MSREKLSEALLRGESGRRDPFSWILRTSLLVVPLSPPPHHAHSTERIASPAHPLRSYPAAVAAAVAALAPAPAASSPEDRRGLLSFRDHRARPDVDSTTSGTRGQCAAERRAVTSGESRRRSASAELRSHGQSIDRQRTRRAAAPLSAREIRIGGMIAAV